MMDLILIPLNFVSPGTQSVSLMGFKIWPLLSLLLTSTLSDLSGVFLSLIYL